MSNIDKKSFTLPALSLKAKLLLGFTGMLVLFLGVALYNLVQVQSIKSQLSQQNEKVELKLMALELKEMTQELNIIASGLEISKKADYIPKYNEKRAIFDTMIKRIGETAATPEQVKWRSRLISLTVDYKNTFDVAAKLVQENKVASADLDKNMEYLYNESQKLMGDIFVNVDQFYITYSHDADEAVANTQSLLDSTAAIMIIASVIVVISGIVIAYLLLSSLIKPIKRLQQAVQSIAQGDLRSKINSTSKDELGALSSSFDHMIDQVRGMLYQSQTIAASLSKHSRTFQDFSGSTASANAEIIRAIQEISTGAEQQASQSEQSTHIINELEQQIKMIADITQTVQIESREAAFNTHTGSNSMESLKEAAKLSDSVLDKVFHAMASLSASSSQINKIVNTIAEISQQTNVLAINAAIEAARAGVHGKGFSIIAEEVRRLSMQTNESSKSIAVIIRSLLVQTKDLGAYMEEARISFQQQNGKMNESLDAFQQIRSSMDQLASHINHIHEQIDLAQHKNAKLVESVQYVAAIAQETAAGVEEVNSTSVLQNSAIVQIASQADDIMLLSQKLFQEVNRFQIGDVTADEEAGLHIESMAIEASIEVPVIENTDTHEIAELPAVKEEIALLQLGGTLEAVMRQDGEPVLTSDKELEAKRLEEHEKKLITVS